MIGTILDNRYEIIEKIGEGGMAKVYKAKCNLLHRFVAIKILKNQYYENEEFINRFKDEALAIAVFSHDNIVDIYDIGNDKNLIYIIMEYVEGKNLKQIINENKIIDNNRALEIAMQIANALKCAHNKNIIHRDIKPHNILINNEGNVKVTDFGIAKATTSVTITNSERIIGSAHYISPEQAKGNVVDNQTDIYSLGVVMYEMVTGKVPFNAESPVSVALKHIQEEIKPPIEINTNIPEGLNRIILKSLEKEKFKRYQNSNELLNDLLQIKNNPAFNIDLTHENEVTRIIPSIRVSEEEKESVLFDERLETPRKDKKNKKYIFITIATILAAVAVFFTSYTLAGASRADNSKELAPKYINIPNIVNTKIEEAEIELNKYNLELVSTIVKSTLEEGIIIECYPYEGTEVNLNEVKQVKVLVSSGQDTFVVPDLENIELEIAKDKIKAAKLTVGDIQYIENEKYSKNIVISQSLKAYSEVEEDIAVDLVVSEGIKVETTWVPNLLGKKYEDALLLIQNAKLSIGEKNQIITRDKALESQVIIQSLKSDLQVDVGTKISISYFVYEPELKVVPDLVGKTVLEAKKELELLGLILSSDGEDDYIIVSQDINALSEIEKGSTVSIQSEASYTEPEENPGSGNENEETNTDANNADNTDNAGVAESVKNQAIDE